MKRVLAVSEEHSVKEVVHWEALERNLKADAYGEDLSEVFRAVT